MSDSLLKSTEVPWPDPDPEIRAALSVPPEDVPRRILIRLLREMDRRHMQLQDKVRFEAEHGLVNYAPLFIRPEFVIVDHGNALAVLELKYDENYNTFQQHHVTVNGTTTIRVLNWPTDFNPNQPPIIEVLVHQGPAGVLKLDTNLLWLGGFQRPLDGNCINVLRFSPQRVNGVVHTAVDIFVVDLS